MKRRRQLSCDAFSPPSSRQIHPDGSAMSCLRTSILSPFQHQDQKRWERDGNEARDAREREGGKLGRVVAMKSWVWWRGKQRGLDGGARTLPRKLQGLTIATGWRATQSAASPASFSLFLANHHARAAFTMEGHFSFGGGGGQPRQSHFFLLWNWWLLAQSRGLGSMRCK